MDEHLAILNNSFTVKEHVKKSYVMKCVDDIKEVLKHQLMPYFGLYTEDLAVDDCITTVLNWQLVRAGL